MPQVIRRPASHPKINAAEVAFKYANDVVSGAIVTGKYLKLAAKRFLRDLKHGHERGLYFDEYAAQHVVDFFGCLRHTKGEWGMNGGQVFKLEPWQVFILANLFGWKTKEGLRRFREAHIEVGRKNGKALALDTPIPTPYGWTTQGALQPGDVIFDERGGPCFVTATTGVQYNRPCYRLRFSDDTTIVADAAHEWLVRSGVTGNGRRGKKRTRADDVRETQDLRRRIKVGKEFNHRICVSKRIVLSEKELLIHPYALGAWLGDGTSDCSSLTCFDDEIVQHISQFIPVKPTGTKGRYCLGAGRRGGNAAEKANSFKAKLRNLGVLNDKHIPQAYLRSSINQRLELLRGLMDTDGTCRKSGQCEFGVTNEKLARSFCELIRTLGYKARIDRDPAQLNGKPCGINHRVQFWPVEPVFYVKRKAERIRALRNERTKKIAIVAIDPVPSVPVKCVEVSSVSHLYLAGEGFTPTHNSTFAAGIGLYLLLADDEPGAEIYSAATKKDQAKIIFYEACRMVEKSPILKSRIAISGRPEKWTNLHVLASSSKFEPLSEENETQDGLNVHGALIDELHQHPSRATYDFLFEATKSRRQPLLITTTTAGYDRQGVCYKQREVGENILVGITEAAKGDSFFVFIACMDEKDAEGKPSDWRDERNWAMANPNLGISVKLEGLRAAAMKAEQDPTALNSFLRKHLNVWTSQDIRWMPPAKWAACNAAGSLISPIELRLRALERLKGRPCYAGLDLSSKIDLSAFVLLFPPIVERKERRPKPQSIQEQYQRKPVEFEEVLIQAADPYWCVLPWFFIPTDNVVERVKKDHVEYDVWVREGLIEATQGNVIDQHRIRKVIYDLRGQFEIKEIGFDSWNASQLANDLKEDGHTMVEVRQGYKTMSEPMKEIMALTLSRKVEHFGNPVLAWNMGNVAAEQDPAGNIKPDKEHSKEKIDGVVALIMALHRVVINPASQPSVYLERGIVFI